MKIVPATLRDMSYVLYHLNPSDEEELACQIDPTLRRDHLAYALLMGGENFAVRNDDQPVAVFGTAPLNRATVSVWALGTKAMPRAAPYISRHMLKHHAPKLLADGIRHMEARSHANHHTAHRWLLGLGAKQHGDPFPFGNAGEPFLLFRWTKEEFKPNRIQA